jgi:hypothetical protein
MTRNLLGAALAALVVTAMPNAGATTGTDRSEFPQNSASCPNPKRPIACSTTFLTVA